VSGLIRRLTVSSPRCSSQTSSARPSLLPISETVAGVTRSSSTTRSSAASSDRFRGRELNTAGDGFLATFDGPARAIVCACSIRDAARRLGLQIRFGLHTGELELHRSEIRGIAVHTGARVVGKAGPGEGLASSTVRDLVAGSGLEFEDRGSHELKGVPGEWRLYAVSNA
jgi:class 3 adenylate cyclase